MGESQKTEYTTVFEGDGIDGVRLEVWMFIIWQMRRDALVVERVSLAVKLIEAELTRDHVDGGLIILIQDCRNRWRISKFCQEVPSSKNSLDCRMSSDELSNSRRICNN